MLQHERPGTNFEGAAGIRSLAYEGQPRCGGGFAVTQCEYQSIGGRSLGLNVISSLPSCMTLPVLFNFFRAQFPCLSYQNVKSTHLTTWWKG